MLFWTSGVFETKGMRRTGLKDTVEPQANGIKMQQAWSTGKQKEVEEQDEPRQEPDRNKAQDPSLLHLPTLSCEQGKVGC